MLSLSKTRAPCTVPSLESVLALFIFFRASLIPSYKNQNFRSSVEPSGVQALKNPNPLKDDEG